MIHTLHEQKNEKLGRRYMEYQENFQELYVVGVLEHCGAIYKQQEMLHRGKKGTFYQCAIILHEYIYEAISYVSDKGIRRLYRLLSVSKLSGEKLLCRDAWIHMEKNILLHRKELSLEDIIINFKYSGMCLVMGMSQIISWILLLVSVFGSPFVLPISKRFYFIGISIILLLAKFLLEKSCQEWFDK